MSVLMTHIAGYPGKYNQRALGLIKQHRPQIVICGHSHILKVIYDKKLQHLHINPGAAGIHGWHQVMTLVTFEINQANIQNCKVPIWGQTTTDLAYAVTLDSCGFIW